jgi:hypothetical protein
MSYFAVSRDFKADYGKVLRYVDELEKAWKRDGNIVACSLPNYLDASTAIATRRAFVKEQNRREHETRQPIK